jgi:hypothetical protein
MLAEGEVRFSCVRSKDGVEEEVSGRGQTFLLLFLVDVEERQRERETFCVTHTTTAGGKILQQQQLKNGRGAFFLLLLLQRENKREP